MIEIKNKERSKITKFDELQTGDIFYCENYYCKDMLYMKTNNFSANYGCVYNCINITSGKFIFLDTSSNVLKVKLICEVEYL